MEIRIVQQNLCSFQTTKGKQLREKFPCERQEKEMTKEEYRQFLKDKYDEYVNNLMNRLLGKKPDVLLLSEFYYNDHKKTVIDRLEREDYKIIYPRGYRILYGIYGDKIKIDDGKRGKKEEKDDRQIINGKYITLDDEDFSQKLFENFCDDEDALEKLLESDNTALINLVEKLYYDDNLKEAEKRHLRDLIFDLYKNKEKKVVKDHGSAKMICVLAVKKKKTENNEEIKFKFDREQSQNLPKCDLRYITGALIATTANKRKEIKIYFTHISGGGERIERKRQLLRAAHKFCADNGDNKDVFAFIGGDFNTDEKEKQGSELWVILKKLCKIFEDTVPKEKRHETTFQDLFRKYKPRRFDYALVSRFLEKKSEVCTTEIIDTIEEGYKMDPVKELYKTDHKALLTTITL